MTLKQRIQDDLKKALTEKRDLEVSVLRMLAAAILNKEKEKRYKISRENPQFGQPELERESRLTDQELIKTLSSEIKKRKEASEIFEKAGRQELAEKEKKEAEILEKYLP